MADNRRGLPEGAYFFTKWTTPIAFAVPALIGAVHTVSVAPRGMLRAKKTRLEASATRAVRVVSVGPAMGFVGR